MSDCDDNNTEFWKTIGKVGVFQSRSGTLPLEVKLIDVSVHTDLELRLMNPVDHASAIEEDEKK